MKYIRLGDLLVKSGTITQTQLDEALKLQSGTGERLGSVLQKHGFITEKQLIDTLMSQLGVEFIDLNGYSIPSEMAQILPKNIAKKHSVVPIRVSRTDIRIAMADPLNFVAIEEVQSVTRRRVIPLIAASAAVDRALQNLYSNQGAMRAIEDMQRDLLGSQYGGAADTAALPQSMAVDEDEADAAPAIRLVNSIIDRACTEGASDIHMEPGEDSMTIRMRIDGILRPIIPVPRELQNSVISRMKIMARMDIAQKQIPQDGRANVTVRQETLDLRISTLPTIHGEKVVIRLLRKSPQLSSLEGIGLEGENRDRFCRLVDRAAEGVILMVGPTGSGKTSTLYAMIDRLKSEEVNLVSLEDPVEYHIGGVCQVQINDKTGLTFASVLRSVLRQDPDIIAVGEIRDGETAEIAMRAAMTGHLVLSTVHTNNAVSSVDRLLDIGVEPYLIAGAVKGIVSQRLVRRLCPHCRRPYVPAPEEQAALGMEPGEHQFYRGEGCGECFGTGYRGRTGVFEILEVTPAMRRAIHARSLKELERAMAAASFLPIMENCRRLILSGVTSAEEVQRVLGEV
ncbi:MAG: type II/IV secretion system protein [Lawsonibacter sp.]|nr:type II/IV secretion system protein [Lawsonibacter sp.]